MSEILFGNRVVETAFASGTGPFALQNRLETYYSRFSEKFQTGRTVTYCALYNDLKEIGYGVLTSENQLTRVHVYDSSTPNGFVNSATPGSPSFVDFPDGAQITIFNDIPAQLLVLIGTDGELVNPGPIRNALFVPTTAAMKALVDVNDLDKIVVVSNGLFVYDADDATAPDNVDTFRLDDTSTGLFKRDRLDIQGDFKGAATIDAKTGDGGELNIFSDLKGASPYKKFRVWADRTAKALRISSTANQPGDVEKNFLTIHSQGTTADRVEAHAPVVLPSLADTAGVKNRSLLWSTASKLEAMSAAELFADGEFALVRGRAAAGDCRPYVVKWTAASTADEDLATVFRPIAGTAASGAGRWLLEVSSVDGLLAASATPSVAHLVYCVTQGGTSITSLLKGYEGQVVVIQRGDADVTLVHGPGADGTIDLGGANYTLTTTSPRITLIKIGSTWRSISGMNQVDNALVAGVTTRAASQEAIIAYSIGRQAFIDDYYLTADGADYYPAFVRAIAASKTDIHFKAYVYPFLTGLTGISLAGVRLTGAGHHATTLQFALATATCLEFGGAVSIGAQVRSLHVTRAAGTIPANSKGIAWNRFNYGHESDVRVSRQAIGRYFTDTAGSTSIGYESQNCYVDTCSEAYEKFADVAGCYIYSCRYGRNGGEAVDVSDACTVFTATVNDITHISCPYLPVGPDATRPAMVAFNDIVGTTGLMQFLQCLSENIVTVIKSNAATTEITGLNISGGRYAPTGTEFMTLHANTTLQYSNIKPDLVGNTLTLTKPYRVDIDGQYLSMALHGGTTGIARVNATVYGNCTIDGVWARLSGHVAAAGTVTYTPSGIVDMRIPGGNSLVGLNNLGAPVAVFSPPTGSNVNAFSFQNPSDASALAIAATGGTNVGLKISAKGASAVAIGARSAFGAALTMEGFGGAGDLTMDTDSGGLRIFPAGSGKVTFFSPINVQSYTVATLPAGAVGDMAIITDAVAATFATAPTGGGSVKVPVYHDGAWKMG